MWRFVSELLLIITRDLVKMVIWFVPRFSPSLVMLIYWKFGQSMFICRYCKWKWMLPNRVPKEILKIALVGCFGCRTNDLSEHRICLTFITFTACISNAVCFTVFLSIAVSHYSLFAHSMLPNMPRHVAHVSMSVCISKMLWTGNVRACVWS